MEEVGAAPGIVARQRGDRRLHLRRRLGHDIERVPGAHGWACSMVWEGKVTNKSPESCPSLATVNGVIQASIALAETSPSNSTYTCLKEDGVL